MTAATVGPSTGMLSNSGKGKEVTSKIPVKHSIGHLLSPSADLVPPTVPFKLSQVNAPFGREIRAFPPRTIRRDRM